LAIIKNKARTGKNCKIGLLLFNRGESVIKKSKEQQEQHKRDLQL